MSEARDEESDGTDQIDLETAAEALEPCHRSTPDKSAHLIGGEQSTLAAFSDDYSTPETGEQRELEQLRERVDVLEETFETVTTQLADNVETVIDNVDQLSGGELEQGSEDGDDTDSKPTHTDVRGYQ